MASTEDASEQMLHCPGDNCQIEAHICRARQVRGYPPCRQCDSGRRSAKPRSPEPTKQDQLATVLDKIVKAYDIRGSYPEQINEDVAWRLGYASADYLLSEVSGYARAQDSSKSLVVGRDMRIGSPELSAAFIDGALAGGANCIDIGMIDSPLLYFAAVFYLLPR